MNEKILVVDDEKEIADLLEVYLKNDNYIVHKYYNGIEALECIQKTEIDLAILDVMLPDIDGFRICQKIRENYYFPVIMLTAKIDDGDKIMGLTIGADDYITKPFYTKELLSRISANLRRSMFNAGNIYKKGDIVVDFDRYKISCQGDELNISTNEFDIVRILIENKGKVVRRDAIYEKIWDIHGNFVEYNTLTVAMSRIKAKLGTYGEKPQTSQHIIAVRFHAQELLYSITMRNTSLF